MPILSVFLFRFVARVFKCWNFSTKDARYTNLLKYTLGNIAYYAVYTAEILDLPLLDLLFLDEASFDAQELKVKRGVSERGREARGLLLPNGRLCHVQPLVVLTPLCAFRTEAIVHHHSAHIFDRPSRRDHIQSSGRPQRWLGFPLGHH